MIKLQDFARDCGVTDRAIQKHLKNHEKHLEGHFQRRGKNGTWLDQTAQDYIRSLMVQQPIVVGDAGQMRENEVLREKISVLQEKLILAQEQALAGQNALMEVQAKQLALDAAEATQKALEAKNEALAAENAAERERAALAEKTAQEASERAQKAEMELAAYKALPWYKKFRRS